MSNPLAALRGVHTLVLDVDGVLTDNTVQVTEDGEQLRTMSIRDGYALKAGLEAGLRIAVITGGSSMGVRRRLLGLGVRDYYSGVVDKAEVLSAYLQEHQLAADGVCYLGDDLPDLPAMDLVGLVCAPQDACPEVLAKAHYVGNKGGGQGFVREVIEGVLKLQRRWPGA